MERPMPLPLFVRRATWRVLVAGVACSVLIAVVGVAGERRRFGATLPDAHQRIEADVQQQFSVLAARLESASAILRRDAMVASATETRETGAVRALFDRLADAEKRLNITGAALTVYGPEARLVAWAGRPAMLPTVRITGPDALFLAQSEVGLRLTRVLPVFDRAQPDLRTATLVAEAPLPRSSAIGQSQDPVMATSVVPVSLRLGFEGRGPDEILVRSSNGVPLAAIAVPPDEIDRARNRWRSRVWAAQGVVLWAVLLLLVGPLLDWRRMSDSIGRHVAQSVVILWLLIAARTAAWFAVRLAGLDRPALASREVAGPFWIALASPLDFLLTSLTLGALVALVASSFEQWRQGRRGRVRVVPARGPGEVFMFVAAQIAAGAIAGALLVAYEHFLRTRLVLVPFDVLHFSLHPFDTTRLAVVTGLVLLHATLLALVILGFRISLSRWVVAGNHRWIRAWIPLLWAAPAATVLFLATREWERPPFGPALLVVAVAIAAGWRLRRFRAALKHATQAARLTAFFVALALPSV
ncbi:MAG: hypothetical protein H0T71_01530, partial [Acidobacteria bacterium]|nr:hypothetical protein [Acidobacteriota bacterium]